MIQGKLYHKIGPLNADDEHAPAFAQLYVYDPDAVDDVAERRCNYGLREIRLEISGAEISLQFHCNFNPWFRIARNPYSGTPAGKSNRVQ